MILLLALLLWQSPAQPKAKPPAPQKPVAAAKCDIHYLPYHWTTKHSPTSLAEEKKYGPPPPVEHQAITIQGMGNCDFTKQKPDPPKGLDKAKVEVKGPNLATIELPQPTAIKKK